MAKILPSIIRMTGTDRLRDDLYRCESVVSQLGMRPAGKKETDEARAGRGDLDGLGLLRLLDTVAEELDRLEQGGADVRAEQARFERVLKQLRRSAGRFLGWAGAEMVAARSPGDAWWWYLDQQVATERRRALIRTLKVGGAALLVLVLTVVLYDRFLAPPPEIRQANTHAAAGRAAALAGDYDQAIGRFEAVVELDPERADVYLWLGVLYHETGAPVRAENAFERARSSLGDELTFLLQRGMLYLEVGDLEASTQDALEVIERAPDLPDGYFLQGSIAERRGDLDAALESFQRASDLAEETGSGEMRAMARVRIATILQQQITAP
jgi:tetratricopeptide (TPR) repeat protein